MPNRLSDLLKQARTADRLATFMVSTNRLTEEAQDIEQEVIAAYERIFAAAPPSPDLDEAQILGIAADYLGLFHKNRQYGNPVSNRRQALRQMNRALRLLHPEAHKEDRAAVHSNLGNLYGSSAHGGPVPEPDALASIRHLEAARSIFTELGVTDRRLPDLHDNLAGAYGRLMAGDRLAHLLSAFEHSRTARALYPNTEAGLDELACLGNALHLSLDLILLARKRTYWPADDSVAKWKATAGEVEDRTSELFPQVMPSRRLIQHLDRIGHQFSRWAEEINPAYYLCAASWYLNATKAHAWLTERGFALPQTRCYLISRGARYSLDAQLAGVMTEDIRFIIDLSLGVARDASAADYIAESLFLRARYHLLREREFDAAIADAQEALETLPPDSWEGVAHAFDTFVLSLPGLNALRPDLLPALRRTVEDVLPRWEPGSLGWNRLSVFGMALQLYCTPADATPDDHIAVVRLVHTQLEEMSPHVSPLLNRAIWSGMIITTLAYLAERGVTQVPSDLVADAEYAIRIQLVVEPPWKTIDASLLMDTTPLGSARHLNTALNLGLDLDTPPPDFALDPSLLTTKELTKLIAAVAEAWSAM
ncbi:hypothetical protein [Streptomyces violascens]|uniref:Tetratricopeptide repeat protein n=1 Tax=Streptomyces violascens TaxID=67381 RepID=A0ABQ3QWI5_9ACTN|nr:hypothetical protein [Streptomyces violascens]GHI41648.1 hypothetical protein Sviol_60560 [Streptomyces violascens]